jgi:choline dehydrogenase-like flavoprotein
MTDGRHIAFTSGAAVELQADYVVVGSGAGGSAAALVLARAGYNVAIVEAGPWRVPDDYPKSMYGCLRDMMDTWSTKVARGDSIMPIVQASLVGGTTVINSSIVVRTPGDVIADWSEQHGLGDVFTVDNIGAAQDRIERELQVTPSDQAEAFGRSSEMMLAAMRARGMEAHPTNRNVANCKGVNQCLQGCSNRRKRSTNLDWIPEVMQRGGTVLSCAPVGRILIKNGRALGATGRFKHPTTHRKGAHFTVRAKRGVLVAASATGSAPLLQKSGYKHPALGEGWRAHPGAGVFGVYPDRVDQPLGPSQGTASIHHRKDIGIKLESLSLPLEVVAGRLSGGSRELVSRLENFGHLAMWITAVRADAVGRIRHSLIGPPSIRYRPTLRDLDRLRRGCALVARLHFDCGATAVLPGVYGLPFSIGPDDVDLIENAPMDNRAWTWVISHLFGGAVMGASSANSVVGADMHVRGVRGLHVVDAAALPTTLGVNPQHTIMAVATVIAQRLANEEKLHGQAD